MIYEKTLSNGLELIIKKTNAPVAAFHVWVDVGSIDENPDEAGYCHFLEHMLFKGTTKRTTLEIAQAVEGAGGDFNAFTSFEYTVFHITISNQRWKLANEILSDMLLNSIFDKKEFIPEKEVILEEVKRGEDSPDRVLYQGLYKNFFGKEGYGRPVIGFPGTVNACTALKLKTFWKKWYCPSLMTVVVTGDIDINEVGKEVEKFWGKTKGHGKKIRDRRRVAEFKQKTRKKNHRENHREDHLRHARHFDVNAIRWIGAVPACSATHADAAALDVTGMILCHGESSRLHRILFREKDLVTVVSGGCWTPARSGMFYFDVETSTGKLLKFRNELVLEIERFCHEGPTGEELERTKNQLESDRIYSSQSMDDVAHRLGYLKSVTGNVRHDLEYINAVKDLTASDIKSMAGKYLKEKTFMEYVLVPKVLDTDQIWSGTEIKPAEKSKPVKVQKKALTDGEVIRLSNGIELVLFERRDVPVVSLQAAALGGLRAETRAVAGVGNLLSDLWGNGPRGYTAATFAQFIESHASAMDAFWGKNSMGLSATTLTKYLDDILPAFKETLFHPELSEKEFEQEKQVVLEEIKTLEDHGSKLVSKIFNECLFKGHPYAFPGIGYEDSVQKLTARELREFYTKCMHEARIVVAVCGKYDKAGIIKTFESVTRKTGSDPMTKKLDFHAPTVPQTVEVKKNREQSHIIVGFMGSTICDEQRFVMKILLTVLGGQSGRLFREIRDKQGLCYTVAPITVEGIEPGYVGVYIGTDPSKREQAIKAIHKELEKISDKPITADELKRAKEYILGRHHMDIQLNAAIVSASGFNTLYGLAFDEHLKWDGPIKKVSIKDVQNLASDLFRRPPVTAIVV